GRRRACKHHRDRAQSRLQQGRPGRDRGRCDAGDAWTRSHRRAGAGAARGRLRAGKAAARSMEEHGLVQIRERGGGFRYRDLLEKRIVTRAGRCVGDYRLIEDGDRVMVCCSGGKDSYALLDVLILLRRRAPIRCQLCAVNVDQGYPGYQQEVVEAHLRTRERAGIDVRMVSHDFRTILAEKLAPDATPCSLCSRLRRGVLYALASEMGATKIALGHHADDVIETLLLNLFFSGKLAAMPPRLRS